MPRGIGTSSGVKESVTGAPATVASACSISGVCWWTPPALYVETAPATLLASNPSEALRPAPLVPEAPTTTMSSGLTRPAARSGARPRTTEVA